MRLDDENNNNKFSPMSRGTRKYSCACCMFVGAHVLLQQSSEEWRWYVICSNWQYYPNFVPLLEIFYLLLSSYFRLIIGSEKTISIHDTGTFFALCDLHFVKNSKLCNKIVSVESFLLPVHLTDVFLVLNHKPKSIYGSNDPLVDTPTWKVILSINSKTIHNLQIWN